MRVGEVIAGRFELERIAGEGGMGTVFLARDREARGPVALKVLHGRLGGEAGKRFTREARVLSTLTHPGIVQHVAHGITDDGELWLAMEWLEGEDLSERLQRGARPGLVESLELVRRAAEALGATHAAGVVHRDIKPGNLFLPGGDPSRVKVLDFGLARRTDGTQMTLTGMVIGTPSYMAPEQARGDRAIDARVDVYALGCVLFELLTGRPPFVGEHGLAVLMKTLLEEPPRLNDLRGDQPAPARVDALVAQLLAKAPEDRPADASAVAIALQGLLAEGVADSQAPSLASQAAPVLTGSERRFVSLVAAGGRGLAATAQVAFGGALTIVGGAPPEPDLAAVAARHEARLERLADGTLVALIAGEGLPTEHAARAARFALALREAMGGSPIAVATGRTLAEGGIPAVPVGEVIERAVETLYGAAGGAVRLDEVTASLLPTRFEVARVGDVLTLVGEHEDTGGVRRLLGRPTPCVGRRRELGQIATVWDWCCDEPGAGAVVVTAAAGVGKSRLVHEFLAQVERSGAPALVLFGRADPVSAGGAYGLVGAALRRWAGVRGDATAGARREALVGALARTLEPAVAHRVAPFLGEVAGVPFEAADNLELRAARGDGRLMADQIRAAWRTWLTAECQRRPVLLVLEDLHWGDRPSVQLVDVALDALGEEPFMALATARPEAHTRLPRLWEARDVTEIKLGGLARRASEKLVRHVLGDDTPEAEVARLVRQADGNAFYLEELIRAAAEGAEVLPESVLGMVEARLAALEPDARRVLRAASVFGTRFARDGVEVLVGADGAGDVPAWLAELADRELVAAADEGDGSRDLVFRNALVREAAYAMLTDDDRALGHRLAADFLEPRGAVDAVALAAHRERARQPEEAARWYVQAARDASHANDFAAAVERAAQAVACGAAGETLGAARLVEAEATMYTGDIPACAEAARGAMDAVEPQSASWHRALGYLIYGLSVLGREEELEPFMRDLRDARPRSDDAVLPLVIAQCQAAYSLQQRGHYAAALEFTRHAEAVAGHAAGERPLVQGRLGALRAFLAVHEGDLPAAVQQYTTAAESYMRVGFLRRACGMRISLGFAYMQMGAYQEARKELLKAVVQSEKLGLGHVAATARQNLGFVLARTGEGEAGLRVERQALAGLEAEGDVRMAGTSRCYLAQILAMGGSVEEAEVEARAAVEALDAFPPLLAQALAVLARLLLDRGAVAQARAEAERAMHMLEALGQVEEGEALLRLVWAEALAASGEPERARREIATARDRILERAARLSDAAFRGRFLIEVPENARTLELAAEWEA